MKIQPTQNNLLVEMHDVQTDSKIHLPDSAKRFPHGLVIAKGPDCKFCNVDDRVLFLPDNLLGFETTEGPKYILNEGSVLGKYIP